MSKFQPGAVVLLKTWSACGNESTVKRKIATVEGKKIYLADDNGNKILNLSFKLSGNENSSLFYGNSKSWIEPIKQAA